MVRGKRTRDDTGAKTLCSLIKDFCFFTVGNISCAVTILCIWNLSTYAVLLYENCQPSRACRSSVKMSGGTVLGFLRTVGVSGFVFYCCSLFSILCSILWFSLLVLEWVVLTVYVVAVRDKRKMIKNEENCKTTQAQW